jgi:hypothetical protein
VQPAPRKAPKYEEAKLQRACIEYGRLQYPKCIFQHNRNEGKLRAVHIGVLEKKGGLNAGFPDITAYCPGPHTFFTELKKPGGKLSPAQVLRIAQLRGLGYNVYVCYSVADFAAACKAEIRSR